MKITHIAIPAALGVIAYLGYEISQLGDSASTSTQTPTVTEVVERKKREVQTPLERVEDRTRPWRKRINTLRAMSVQEMDDSQVDQLFGLLDNLSQATQPEDFVVLNDIMGKIVQSGIRSDELTDKFSSILNDTSLHEVVRDYAAQYLGGWIAPQNASHPREQDTQKITHALTALAANTTDPANQNKSIAGTSLMMLVYADQANIDLSPITEQLDTWLDEQLMSSKSVTLRADVINAVGMLDRKAQLPTLRMIANDSQAHPSHRLTSISSIGLIGNTEDIGFLENIAQTDSKFKYAATAALQKLSKTNQ